jgi:murein DD-endopeptidase MepM/ murein hydrolase activator NlpD
MQNPDTPKPAPRKAPAKNAAAPAKNGTTPAPKQKRSAKRTGGTIQQIGLNMLMIGLLALLGYMIYQRLTGQPLLGISSDPVLPQIAVNPEQPPAEGGAGGENQVASLNPFALPGGEANSIQRKSNLKTIIPSRPRTNVITYTVDTGDTLFSIAYNFGIKPETILFGNYDALEDNPHLLKPKQVLNILPINGAYYKWKEGDTLDKVATLYSVEPQAIIDYSGNNIDLAEVKQGGDAGFKDGDWVIIPGGKRALRDWGPPAISRSNPAVARYYGEGACGSISSGAVGNGTFVWPTTDHSISGYSYDSSVHPGIDIGGQEGNPIYATDGGVVVFAGWSAYGYGYMIVIDHGNGWQSAYAHLSAVGVSCGQSVFQGGHIGALGTTGNSSGPHLHFELSIGGAKVNPLDYTR